MFSGDMSVNDENRLSSGDLQESARRNLLADFATPLKELKEKHMNVYLRVRPFTEKEISNKEDKGCMKVLNPICLMANAPPCSNTYKNSQHGCGKQSHKFTFSKIFPAHTKQCDFFEQTIQEKVKNFIEGQNCLVFTYGVTNSGKTYTIQGEPKDAGILPRSLDVIFNSIQGRQLEVMHARPYMFCDAIKLTARSAEKQSEIKEEVLKLAVEEEDSNLDSLLGHSTLSQKSETSTLSGESGLYDTSQEPSQEEFAEMFKMAKERVREEGKVSVDSQGDVKYSIWVSYAELYNESVYDLLAPIPKKKNSRRPTLSLRQDQNSNPYIKDLREICVNSADQAYKIMTIGKQNLHMACTKLNHNSSRSHCIFTIKILRFVDTKDPSFARTSMLSFCDLAGSERYGKTQTEGDRIKEAGNINTSLLTLGRCITLLRHNQNHPDSMKIVPFRDSKLTRIFQSFFCGRGKACMIVNVNQCASTFDETLHALKYSAVAKQVIVTQEVKEPPKPRLKRMVSLAFAPTPEGAKNARHTIEWGSPGLLASMQTAVENEPLPDDDTLDETLEDANREQELLHTISLLKNQLIEEKKKSMDMESQIREEICNEMAQQLVILEEQHNEALNDARDSANNRAERKIEMFMQASARKKRKCNFEREDELTSKLHGKNDQIADLNAEVTDIKGKLATLKQHLSQVTQERDKLWTENSQFQFDVADLKTKLQDTNESIDNKSVEDQSLANKQVIDSLEMELNAVKDALLQKEDENKDLTEMLTEAGEVFTRNQKTIEDLQHEHQIVICEKDDVIESLKKQLSAANTELKQAKDCTECQNKITEIGNLVSRISDLEFLVDANSKLDNKSNIEKTKLQECEKELKLLKIEYASLEQKLNDEKYSNDNDKETRQFEINELQESLCVWKENFEEKDERLKLLQEKLNEQEKLVEKLTNQIEVNRKDLAEGDVEKSTKIEELKNRLKEENEKNSLLSSELRDARDEISSCKQGFEQSAQAANDVIREKTLEAQAANDVIKEKTVEAQDLKRQLEELKELYKSLTDSTESATEEKDRQTTLITELQGHLDKYMTQVRDQSDEINELRPKADTCDAAVKKANDLESRIGNERKSHREAISETEALIQQKSIKIEELSTTIEGLEQKVKHLTAKAAETEDSDDDNTTDEIKRLKEQVRQFDNAAHEAEYKAQMIERQLRREKNIIENLLKEKDEQLVEASSKLGDMQSQLESSLYSESKWSDQQRELLEVRGQVADLQERLKQATDYSDTHQSDNGFLKLELEKQTKQVIKLEEVIHELETCLSLSKKREAQSCEGTDSYKKKCKDLNVELGQKEDQIQKLENTIQDMKSAELELVQANQNEVEVVTEKLLDAEKSCKEMKAEIMALNNRLGPLLDGTNEEHSKHLEEKVQQIAALETVREEQLQTIQRMSEEINDLKVKNLATEEKYKEMKELTDSNEKQLTETAEKTLEASNELSNIKQQLKAAEDSESAAKDTVIALKAELKKQMKEIEKLEEKVFESQEMIKSKEEEFDVAEASTQEKMKELEQINGDQKTKVADLENELKDLQDNMNELKMTNEQSVTKASDLESQRQEQQDQIEALQQEIEKQKQAASLNTVEDSELRKQLRAAAEAQVQQNNQISALEEEVSAAQLKLDDLEKEKRQLKNELQTTEEKLSEEQHKLTTTTTVNIQEVQKLRLCIENHESKIGHLQENLESKDEDIETIKQKLHKVMNETQSEQKQHEISLKEAKEQIQGLKQALEVQETTMEKQDKVIEDKTKQVQQLMDESSDMKQKGTTDMEQLKNKNQEMKTETEYLSAQLTDIRDMLQNEQEKLEKSKNECLSLTSELTAYREQASQHSEAAKEVKDLQAMLNEKESQIAQLLKDQKSVEKSNQEIAEARRQTEDHQNNLHLLRVKFKTLEENNAKLSKELDNQKQQVEEKEKSKQQELSGWREERDKLVGDLHKIVKDKCSEVERLTENEKYWKAKVEDQDDMIRQMSEHLEKGSKTRAGKHRGHSSSQSDDEISDLKQKVAHLQSEYDRVVRGKDEIISDLRASNLQLQSSITDSNSSRPVSTHSTFTPPVMLDGEAETPFREKTTTASSTKKGRRNRKRSGNDENVPKSSKKSGKHVPHGTSSTRKKRVPDVLQLSMENNLTTALDGHETIDLDEPTPAQKQPSTKRAGRRHLRSTQPSILMDPPQAVEPVQQEISAQNIVLRQLRSRRK